RITKRMQIVDPPTDLIDRKRDLRYRDESKIVLEFHLYRIGQEHHPVRRIEGEYADLPLQLGSRLLIRIGGLEAAQIRDRELRFNRIQIIDRIDRQLAVRAGYLVRSAGDGSKRTDRHVRKPDRKLRFELD